MDPLTFMVGSIEFVVNGEGGGRDNNMSLEAARVVHIDVPPTTEKCRYQPKRAAVATTYSVRMLSPTPSGGTALILPSPSPKPPKAKQPYVRKATSNVVANEITEVCDGSGGSGRGSGRRG